VLSYDGRSHAETALFLRANPRNNAELLWSAFPGGPSRLPSHKIAGARRGAAGQKPCYRTTARCGAVGHAAASHKMPSARSPISPTASPAVWNAASPTSPANPAASPTAPPAIPAASPTAPPTASACSAKA